MNSISPLYAAAERDRQEADAQLAADLLLKMAELQCDLMFAKWKANSDGLRAALASLDREFKYWRDDHAIPELIDFTEVSHD